MTETKILDSLCKAVIDGDEVFAKKLAEESITKGIDPLLAIKEGLAKGIAVIGEKFSNFEVFLPEVMLAADAMKIAMDVLIPTISKERLDEARPGVVVIGTVYGDIHDIGKNLVAAMLSVAGFEVNDLGGDVPVKTFIEKAKELKADIIAMSCLLSPSMFYQKGVIKYLRDAGIRKDYYVIVGGGPITPEFAKEIGADGWGKYSDDGVEVCKRFMKESLPRPLKEPIIMGV
jgi:corrinoid protein of di/trimethylamine methyltransferase